MTGSRIYAESNVQLYRQLIAAGHGEAELRRVRAAYELAADLFTGCFRASGRPFLSHLVRTASILVWLRAPLDLALAGLLHGAYAQGDFGDGERGITPERQAELRRAVGHAVERLVSAYTELPWDSRTGLDRPFDELDALDRDVLLIRLANELEDHIEFDVSGSSDAERRLEYLRASGDQMVQLARRVGQPELAETLERSFAECTRTPLPAYLRSSIDHSYSLAPRSCRVRLLRHRLAARRLARKLFGPRRAA